MYIYETIQVPATERKVIKKILCDCCSKEISKGLYSAFESDLHFKDGDSYPDNGHGKMLTVNFCKKCMKNVSDFVESIAPNVKWEEWEY